jgi:hypothetical protein
MQVKATPAFPLKVAQRIMRRAAKGERLVLTFDQQGKPSRIYGYQEYQKMQELPHRIQPWKRRNGGGEVPDPLGMRGFKGKILRPLNRAVFYEE